MVKKLVVKNKTILILVASFFVAVIAVVFFLGEEPVRSNMTEEPEVPEVEVSPVKIDAIKLQWDTVDGASRYLVYRKDKITGEKELLTVTGQTAYVDTGLKPEVEYDYSVNSMGSRFNLVSDDTEVSEKTAMPQVGIKAYNHSAKFFRIQWDDTDMAEKYILYRSLSPYGPFEKVGTFTNEDHNYYLSEKDGYDQNYYFKLKAVSEWNGEVFSSESTLDAHDVEINMSHPMPGEKYDSDFGKRSHPIYGRRIKHEGIDFTCDYGEKIYAACDGVVVMRGYIKNFLGLGNSLWIYHGNGIMTVYAHNSNVLVKQGKHVEAGEAVAEAGATGLATGVHLHFEVRKDYKPIDPKQFFDPPLEEEKD